jgi:hypothetical protein
MNGIKSPQTKADPNAAVSFAAMLREELVEIAKLRKKRHWEDGPATGHGRVDRIDGRPVRARTADLHRVNSGGGDDST